MVSNPETVCTAVAGLISKNNDPTIKAGIFRFWFKLSLQINQYTYIIPINANRLKTLELITGSKFNLIMLAIITTHRKLLYPSVGNSPIFHSIPWPSAKFKAYLNEINASSTVKFHI
ncbi:MAG: hypothetical protein Kow0019_05950 [Methanobacteriaceae archaeon]